MGRGLAWARLGAAAVLASAGLATSCASSVPVRASAPPLVPLAEAAPGVRCELVYATAENFTRQVLYDGNVCLLRAPVAERLARVARRLASRGLTLVVLDAYRPLSVQRKMWALVPDERFVADPAKGSKHNRGASVDVTLQDRSGQRLPMPTPFDDFTAAASRDAPCARPEPCANRAVLQDAMEAEGFVGLATEWWHFDSPDWQRYQLLDLGLGELGRR